MSQEQKKIIWGISLFFKGMTMGICDLIPGVSGGTIALITGIYERLLHAINQIRWKNIKLLLKGKFHEFWTNIDGNFLAILASGIGFSFLTFGKLIYFLHTSYSSILYSFFLGLVLSSSIHLLKESSIKKPFNMLIMLSGFFLIVIVLHLPTLMVNTSYLYLFVCAFIAISAMILPGISGAFILLILGTYNTILIALTELHFKTLLVFGVGCILGLISTAHLLSLLLKKFYAQILSFLTGVLLASTLKLWPWKLVQDVVQVIHSDGSITFKPILEKNVWFNQYSIITHAESLMNINTKEPYLLFCIISFCIGIILVLILQTKAKK